MSDTLIVGLLSLVGTVLGSLGGVLSTQRLTAYKLEQLQKEVARHNGLIDRTYQLESRMRLCEKDIHTILK